ncbi:MAG: hypothetical protein ACJATI_002813 [Halioglobus sp.]|jgi:hypothetical protein
MKNSNDYWYFDENSIYSGWLLNFRARFITDYEALLCEYMELTFKYGFLLPGMLNENDLLFDFKKITITRINQANILELDINLDDNLHNVDRMLASDDIKGNYISFGNAYWFGIDDKYLIPSILFFFDEKGDIQKKPICDVKNIHKTCTVDCATEYSNYPPLIFNGLGGIGIYLRTNLFFSKVNKKDTLNEFGDRVEVDNSELALLNTPRFNSFLRDLMSLCEKFNINLQFESEHPNVIKEGILLDGELIYYEDIEDLLEDKYKIENLYKDLN